MSGLRIIATFAALGAAAAGLGAMAACGYVAQRLGLAPQPRRTLHKYASRQLRIEAKRWRTGHSERKRRWEGRAT